MVEAIDADDPAALLEELGDLLFQVVLLAQVAREAGWFDLDDVCRAITDKMVRRHPHVFDPEHEEPDAGSIAAWEARKARERDAEASALDGIPRGLPALLAAHRAGEKASRAGLDWTDAAGARQKVSEELAELDAAAAAGDLEAAERELGDLLHALAQWARLAGLSAEDALRGANARFARRFRALEQAARKLGRSLHDLDADTLEALWRSEAVRG